MSESADAHSLDPMVLERIELAFPELVGGFHVCERELAFDSRPIADLLAYSQGRLLLISLVDGGDQDSVLRALDGLAFARTQVDMLADFLPADAPESIETRVVLVSVSGFSSRQLERLSVLRDDGLWLLRKRELRTKLGTHTRLEPIDISDGLTTQKPLDLPAWALSEPHRSFLSRIAPDRLELAISLVDRLRRIDSACEWALEVGELVCAFQGAELCRLSWSDGHLAVSFDEDSAAVPVRDVAAIDWAVDSVLAEFIRRLNPAAEPAKPVPPAPARRAVPAPRTRADLPLAPEPPAGPFGEFDDEDDDLPDLDDDDDLEQIDLKPRAPEPLLSRAEIEAFQE